MVSASPTFLSLRPIVYDSTRTSCSSSVVFVFMPRLPLRRRLLDELDDKDHSFKRARLATYLQDLSLEDLFAPTSDGESDNSDTSSASSLTSGKTQMVELALMYQ